MWFRVQFGLRAYKVSGLGTILLGLSRLGRQDAFRSRVACWGLGVLFG